MPKYFRCNTEICKNSPCCRGWETRPIIGLADFVRISERTGETVGKIWREKGVVRIEDLMGVPAITLGLKHDPCPYLSNNRCSIYDGRPLTCAAFPIAEIIGKPEKIPEFSSYGCLNSVEVMPEQRRYWQRLKGIMNAQAIIDLKYIWARGFIQVKIGEFDDYIRIARDSLDAMEANDPEEKSPRTKEALKAAMEMKNMFEPHLGDSRVAFNRKEMAPLLEAMLYVTWERPIENLLIRGAMHGRKECAEVTRQFRELEQGFCAGKRKKKKRKKK